MARVWTKAAGRSDHFKILKRYNLFGKTEARADVFPGIDTVSGAP
jgi:hypothetical protein